jgi:hypothetical protein
MYEKIKKMNIIELAELFYEICHQKDLEFIQYLNTLGIKADLVEVEKDLQIFYNINLLESEYKEGENIYESN